jgi:hypothetical protein
VEEDPLFREQPYSTPGVAPPGRKTLRTPGVAPAPGRRPLRRAATAPA